MARKFFTDLVLVNRASDPGTGLEGELYFNTTSKKVRIYSNNAWIDFGIQGIQGSNGAQGIQGVQGTSGIQGVSGSQGIQGSIGQTGSQGIQGTIGSQGANGTQGLTGSQGLIGTQGVTGSQGTQGITGETGIQGLVGNQGIQGSIGLGIVSGGTTGQILAKIDEVDYNTEWIDNYTSSIKHEVKLGETISKGQAVYVSSADGTNMVVSKASNSSETTSSKTMGLLETSGILNDHVFVITEGILAGLDTSAAGSEGDPVWLGISGNLLYGLSNKPVAPAHLVFIGIVTRKSATVGEIFVKVQNGFELQELHNVQIQGVQDTEVLAYDSATGLWKNTTVYGVQGTTGSQGLQGFQGLQGLQGITGTGTQGIQGLSGSGAYYSQSSAPSGTISEGAIWFNTNTGVTYIYVNDGTSSQWVESNPGYVGLQGTQGIAGSSGSSGSQGTQGIQGLEGLQGIQGTIGVGTQGTTGFQGTTGPQGLTGSQGTTGAGTQGTTGIQGLTGTQGITGGAAVRSIIVQLDGFNNVLATGIKADVMIPFACTINEWTLLSTVSGSMVIDIWKDTYANYPPTVADTITASAKPTISSSTKGQSSTLTGWTTTVNAGDTLRFNIDSVTSITKAVLILKVTA